MKVPQLARYNGTVEQAYNFSIRNITNFPLNLFELIHNLKWGLITYEEMAIHSHCSVDTVCKCLGTDGYSIYNGYNYTIAYNNTIKSQGRINFTLAHEIGHIILNHHKDFEVTEILQNNFTKEEYKILENEANCFARNILAPAPLVSNLSFLGDFFKIQSFFDITPKATATRLSFLNNDLYYLTDTQIFNFRLKYKRYKQCNNCQTNYLTDDMQYCPICGNTKLILGDVFSMKEYKCMDIQSLHECPVCENGEISIEDDYCKICGLYLKNKCTNCETELAGNARYCTNCGNVSTFYSNNILKSWEAENLNYNISSIELKKFWNNFTNYLKSSGKMILYSNLVNTNLVLLADNTIGINFPNKLGEFSYALLTNKENLTFLLSNLSAFVGRNISIQFLNNNKKFKGINNISTLEADELPF